jgi:diguanylate cyclase (GGDEF)-like protein
VGWPGRVQAGGPQATVAALLAHEAASVIVQADKIDQLTDLAQTDPLTGLPNRRAWDARLRHVVAEARTFTLAIIDLDHFKAFNDTHGHPAGDRLLVETSAAWLDQLRGGDMLARIGGEEFCLLLLDCQAPDAREVIDRLRTCVTQGGTCAAGFATRISDEPAEEVMARADAALYEAKNSGRDRACLSSST